jgi:hypothetical protein
MTDIAYDITHLLEFELASSAPANPRVMKTSSISSRPPVAPSVEDILARELMQSAGIHEALIQQYLRMAGSA